eukprot:TRINITY_DN3154_c1_g1_i2.p1 TRINITY_DN3154_c1_g1~~TRINITY_DN3154_c1_g1_i2.p1  ORF type:complete len:371 (-),score=25.47 TRINITY_DN3154_c1_g1_i2:16-1128(-)
MTQVVLAALCGSDLHPYHERERGLKHGTVMGHEFVGYVHEVGSGVSKLHIGDRVCTPFTSCCGSCYFCDSGLTSRCTHGQLFGWLDEVSGDGLHGGQAQYIRVPLADSTLVTLPSGLSSDPTRAGEHTITNEEALFAGDILSTGMFCATMANIAGLMSGETGLSDDTRKVFVVVGCGPVGLMTVLCARELARQPNQDADEGDSNFTLFAVDCVPERLEVARSFGATPIHFEDEDVVSVVMEASGNRGADAVMEVVGSHDALKLAYSLVRPGGYLSSVGVHTSPTIPFSAGDVYDKNLTYRSGRCPARHFMEKVIPLLKRGIWKDELRSVSTHTLPIEKVSEAYTMFDRREGGCIKVFLDPWSQTKKAEGV